jgi:hypothetical protein
MVIYLLALCLLRCLRVFRNNLCRRMSGRTTQDDIGCEGGGRWFA